LRLKDKTHTIRYRAYIIVDWDPVGAIVVRMATIYRGRTYVSSHSVGTTMACECSIAE